MTSNRLEAFRAMVVRSPSNALARFGLANEALKAGEWAEAERELRAYLTMYPDEGNGFGRHAESLNALGRTAEARDALRLGIDAAHRNGHPGLAAELNDRLAALEESA